MIHTQTLAGHTIGRVWSKQRNEWLYFDVFGAVVVFHLNDRHELEVLKRADPFPGSVSPDLAAARFGRGLLPQAAKVLAERIPGPS